MHIYALFITVFVSTAAIALFSFFICSSYEHIYIYVSLFIGKRISYLHMSCWLLLLLLLYLFTTFVCAIHDPSGTTTAKMHMEKKILPELSDCGINWLSSFVRGRERETNAQRFKKERVNRAANGDSWTKKIKCKSKYSSETIVAAAANRNQNETNEKICKKEIWTKMKNEGEAKEQSKSGCNKAHEPPHQSSSSSSSNSQTIKQINNI